MKKTNNHQANLDHNAADSHQVLYSRLMQSISEEKTKIALTENQPEISPGKNRIITSLRARLIALFSRKPKNPV